MWETKANLKGCSAKEEEEEKKKMISGFCHAVAENCDLLGEQW
jgi:hypothetical protein